MAAVIGDQTKQLNVAKEKEGQWSIAQPRVNQECTKRRVSKRGSNEDNYLGHAQHLLQEVQQSGESLESGHETMLPSGHRILCQKILGVVCALIVQNLGFKRRQCCPWCNDDQYVKARLQRPVNVQASLQGYLANS